MVKRINLGGRRGNLCVEKHQNRYEFINPTYSMYLTLYKVDVKEYLLHQNDKRWGVCSNSNSISDVDKEVIRQYLLKNGRKYKTVIDVVKSRSKNKEIILREEFTLNELIEYKTEKEKANGKNESCS